MERINTSKSGRLSCPLLLAFYVAFFLAECPAHFSASYIHDLISLACFFYSALHMTVAWGMEVHRDIKYLLN